MADPTLLKALPELVAEGLITEDQAERIRARYRQAAPVAQGGRTMALFGVLGALLVGLGVILVVAHNWDDLGRNVRTLLAFLPVLIGQGLVLQAMRNRAGDVVWREGSALFLACGLCAAVSLIAQIHHIDGELDGYLLTCAVLILPLLYLPGSLLTAVLYLAMITWYGFLAVEDRWNGGGHPWPLLLLLAAAVPAYLRAARSHGTSVAFWWLGLAMALAVGVASQLFYDDWTIWHGFALVALGGLYTLAPWLHRDSSVRSWPWALVGGATVLIALAVYSYADIWRYLGDRAPSLHDRILLIVYGVLAVLGYALSLRRRRPFEVWPYPEAFGLILVALAVYAAGPGLAALMVNVGLLVVGVLTARQGILTDSLRRMNLGLLIISLTIVLRFFDTDLSYVLRGLVFIGIGIGFLYMNKRMLRQRRNNMAP